MPDMMNLPQPPNTLLTPRRSSSVSSNGFPEYLKHTNLLGDCNTKLKLSASNSLFHAVLKGRLRGARYLLDRSATVNGRNDYGFSVLTAALHVDDEKRRDKLFRMLLDRGADPLFKDEEYNRNVLHWACLLGRTDQVKILLRDVAGEMDLSEKDKNSHTALHHAVMAGHMPIVTLLTNAHRKFGVSVDQADKLGLTPYLHAKRLGYRDVAEILRTVGLASQGHGDMMFRTPREWSQIGKFERQKAIEINTQEAINFAKIKGKITHVRHLEDSLSSPRMAVPNIVLPSYSPSRDPEVKLARKYPERISRSLPSLKEFPTHGDQRPLSANGQPGGDETDTGDTTTRTTDKPQPPKIAFVAATGQNQTEPQDLGGAEGTSSPGATVAGRGNMATLMEMNEKARHARGYRQSQFDKSKASEYRHMLGNLTSIMDLLSQQQSTSFRQSVKYQKPETPKQKKKKNKVSSLAVIFGRDKSGRRSHKKRSPKPSAQKTASVGRNNHVGDSREKRTKGSDKKVSLPLLKVK